MTSAADRRLAKLEQALSPIEAVLAWLAEAQQYPSIEAQARAIAARPVDEAPLSVIGQRIEASVRASLKGQPSEVVSEKVRRGVGDGAFLFCLVLQINSQACELARVEGLRAAGVFYWMGCLLCGPPEADLPPLELAAYREDLAACWARWRSVVHLMSIDVLVESEARTQLEKRYFGGRDVFFPDTAEAWSSYVDLVHRIAGLAEMMARPEKPRTRRRGPDASDPMTSLDERVAHRAQILADDARVRTFEIMGDRERAVTIIERRLMED